MPRGGASPDGTVAREPSRRRVIWESEVELLAGAGIISGERYANAGTWFAILASLANTVESPDIATTTDPNLSGIPRTREKKKSFSRTAIIGCTLSSGYIYRMLSETRQMRRIPTRRQHSPHVSFSLHIPIHITAGRILHSEPMGAEKGSFLFTKWRESYHSGDSFVFIIGKKNQLMLFN